MSPNSDEDRARKAVGARYAPDEEIVPSGQEALSGGAGNGLVVSVPAGPLRPVASPHDLVDSMKTFEMIKKGLLIIDHDTYEISGKNGPENRIAKSGWRKLALAFGISDEIIHEEYIVDDTVEPPHMVWHIRVRVSAAGGRTVEGIGTASSKERKFSHIEHDLHALAHTRAKSRAIADMLGSSDKIYEEDDGGDPGAPLPTVQDHQKENNKERNKMRIFLEDILGETLAAEVQVITGGNGYDVLMPRTASQEDGELFCKRMTVMGYVVKKDDRGAFVIVSKSEKG